MSDVYEIDRLIDAKWSKNHWKYLVHWKGYNDSDDSWVIETDFDSSGLINDFWSLHDQRAYINKSKKIKKEKSKVNVEVEESYYDYDCAPFIISNEKEILSVVKAIRRNGRFSYLVTTKLSNIMVLLPSEMLMEIAPVKLVNYLETLIKK